MRRITTGGVFCLALATVGGCATPPAPPPPPASATAAIDGTYKGLANGSCGASEAKVVVYDRHFTLSVADGLAFDGVAQPNGVLRAAKFGEDGRELNFAGHIDGADMRGGSYNGRCALAFMLNRT